MTALHNIPTADGRLKAVSELWRVLRPGGQILIFDIRHARTYLKHLRDLGAISTNVAGPILLWGPLAGVLAQLRPTHGKGERADHAPGNPVSDDHATSQDKSWQLH